LQSSAQQYHGGYPYGYRYPAWDTGAGWAAAATGAAIGATAAASAAQGSATAAYTASQPCPSPVTVPVGPITFFKCGSTWYRQVYGPGGPAYIAVARPGL
jgi:hypothetical protein